MNKYQSLFLAILLLCFFTTKAQHHFSFWKLGSREMLWVVFHPFVANKTKKISAKSIQLSDSIAKAEAFPNLQSGGEKDALRHGLWMALLAQRIGSKKALKLGAAHERKNWKDFKRKRLEEGSIPDFKAGEMDTYNNEKATEIAENCIAICEDSTLVNLIIQTLYKGQFKIIKMDRQGNSLNENDIIIPQKAWEGKWQNNRQLAPSNNLLKP